MSYLKTLYANQMLIYEITKREISERYVGQVLGVLWAVGHPLIIMAVYLFIFTVVFKQKVSGIANPPVDVGRYIISGLIPWMCFQEVLNKSCTAFTQNASLVKQIVFPIEILPLKYVLAAFFSQVITTLILLVYMVCSGQKITLLLLLLPVLWLTQIIAMLGTAYLLSSVGVFFRDLKDIVQVFSFVGMYLMPMFYLIDWMPKILRPAAYCNPFSYMLWCYHDIFYYGTFHNSFCWLVFVAGSILTLVLGLHIFFKLKHMFGDVL